MRSVITDIKAMASKDAAATAKIAARFAGSSPLYRWALRSAKSPGRRILVPIPGATCMMTAAVRDQMRRGLPVLHLASRHLPVLGGCFGGIL